MTEEERFRDRARSYAGVYKRRGHLIQEPCRVCGSEDSQMHHPDYHQPLYVIWLCAWCHRKLHEGIDDAEYQERIKKLREIVDKIKD